MNKKQPIKLLFIFASALAIFGSAAVASAGYAYAKNIWDGDDTMGQLVKDIDKGKVDDDNMNWKDFKSSKIYQQEDIETQQCIKNRQDLSNNLADYEVLRCFKDSNYAYDN